MAHLTVIILAAGKGTRMKSASKHYSKVAFPILGEPIVSYVLDAVKGVKPSTIVTIVGFGGETTKKIVHGQSEIVWQKEQKGTGHAVLQAKKYIKNNKNDMTLVLCGDAPLIRTETLKKLAAFHTQNHNDQTLLSAIVPDPFGYGRIVRDSSKNLVKVVEQTDTTLEEARIKEVNTGVVIFNNAALLKGLSKLTNKNAKQEYYLTQLISIFLRDKRKVGVMITDHPEEMDGINDRYQLSVAQSKIQARINKGHMFNGVSIMSLNTVFIGPYVKIGPDTVIEPNTVILGHTTIGKEAHIGANSYIVDSNIKSGMRVEPSSYIKNNKKAK